jgi:hypothetical protein
MRKISLAALVFYLLVVGAGRAAAGGATGRIASGSVRG